MRKSKIGFESLALIASFAAILLATSCRCAGSRDAAADTASRMASSTSTTNTTTGDANGSQSPSAIAITVDTPSSDGKTSAGTRSFVSTDHLTFHCGDAAAGWTADGLAPTHASGSTFVAQPHVSAAPSGRKSALQCKVTVASAGQLGHVNLVQDDIDVIRQQYVDMKKLETPPRKGFVSSGGSAHFTFADIRSRDGAKWAWFSAFPHLEEWRSEYGGALSINRGFTTPLHNAAVPGAAKNSQHIYGTAGDVASAAADWDDKRDAAKRAGACTEPLAVSGTAHVHGDWREDGCPPGW